MTDDVRVAAVAQQRGARWASLVRLDGDKVWECQVLHDSEQAALRCATGARDDMERTVRETMARAQVQS